MSETIMRFLIRGSQPDPYEVVFKKNASNLTALCSCPAGVMNTYCKHRFSLLWGEITDLVSENSNDVSTLREWLVGTDIEMALQAVSEAEKEAELAKKKLAACKKALARVMQN